MNPKEDDQAIFDKKELLNLMDGDEKLLNEVMEVFLGDVPQQIVAMKKAIEERDSEHVEHKGHNLKGASLNVAAPQLASIALNIENAGKTDDLDLASSLLIQLEQAFADFLDHIEK